MLLDIIKDLNNFSDNIKSKIEHGDSINILIIFAVILIVSIIGYNILHKGE